MRFICKHLSLSDETYFTTVDADNEPEAALLAKRYNRKGYIVASIKQQLGKE